MATWPSIIFEEMQGVRTNDGTTEHPSHTTSTDKLKSIWQATSNKQATQSIYPCLQHIRLANGLTLGSTEVQWFEHFNETNTISMFLVWHCLLLERKCHSSGVMSIKMIVETLSPVGEKYRSGESMILNIIVETLMINKINKISLDHRKL